MDGRDNYTIDGALSAVGFGTFQRLLLCFSGIGWLSEAMEMNLLSFVGPAVKSEWSLSPAEESFLSTAVFGGMLFGAFFWGFIADYYGRRKGVQAVPAVTALAGLLSAFSPNYKFLVIFRCLVGFGVSGGHIFGSWLLEFIPSLNRGAWMLSLLVYWIFGELFEASIAWIIMPWLGWRWLLAVSSTPCFIVLFFSIFTPESPRYLFMKGKRNEAISILERIARVNGKKLPTGSLVSDERTLPEEEATEETRLLLSTKKMTFLESTSELFSSDLLGTTLLMWILHLTFTFSYYGVVLLTSTLSSIDNTDCASSTLRSGTKTDTSLYVNVFITCLAEFPGLIAATLLVDKIGRKLTIESLMIVGLVLILLLSFHQSGVVTTALLFGARMFIFGSYSTLTIYVREVYPTCIRAFGSGIAISIGRVGGMICPLIAVGLVRGCHQTAAVLMFGVILIVSGICVMLFPFETEGRELRDI